MFNVFTIHRSLFGTEAPLLLNNCFFQRHRLVSIKFMADGAGMNTGSVSPDKNFLGLNFS
jgi:hypothetical protein